MGDVGVHLFPFFYQLVSPTKLLDGTVRQSLPLVSVVMNFVARSVVFSFLVVGNVLQRGCCIYFLLVVENVRHVTLYCCVHCIVIT